MLFNSHIFWVFFAVVLLLYRGLGHRNQNRMLLGASWLFYGWWDWRFLLLLIGTSVMDFALGRAIGNSTAPRRRKALLIISVCVDLGLLGFFKYANFFSAQLAAAFASLGVNVSMPMLHVILPVGISFYTFQELSYILDVYRGEIRPVKRLDDFLLYVAFFPQLVAGPIERSSRLIPQILRPRRSMPDDFSAGLYLVLTGLFRKVIVADNMAAIADAVFATPAGQLSGIECLAGVYAFAFQIYGDFSGYSAIAQGIARWLGFDLMTNFRHPYLAISPSDFWRRWHISLSTWLRDYLYIPLGGNRGRAAKTYRNLLLTMVIGGFWHGAAWTFIAWGAFHGLLLCLYRPIEKTIARWTAKPPTAQGAEIRPISAGDYEAVHLPRAGIVRAGRQLLLGLLMFHLVCVGWLLFRAESIGQANAFLARILTDFRMTPHASYALGAIAFYAGPMLIYELWLDRKADVLALTESHWLPRGLVYAYCALMLWIFTPEVGHAFIYFQF